MTIEAMKQALEALEKCAVIIDGEWGICRTLVEMDETDCLPQNVRGPIIALRIAIAAAEKQEAAERYIHEYRSKPHPGDFGIPRGHWWQAKQYADVLYTTPPAQSMLQPDAFLQNGMLNPKYTTPPAAQQEPDAYGYAKRLAVAIWEQHYKGVAPQWKPLDDLIGVLTQIDNMTAGLTFYRQPLTDEKIDDIWNRYCDEMGEASINDAYDIARAIEAAHGIKGKNHG